MVAFWKDPLPLDDDEVRTGIHPKHTEEEGVRGREEGEGEEEEEEEEGRQNDGRPVQRETRSILGGQQACRLGADPGGAGKRTCSSNFEENEGRGEGGGDASKKRRRPSGRRRVCGGMAYPPQLQDAVWRSLLALPTTGEQRKPSLQRVVVIGHHGAGCPRLHVLWHHFTTAHSQ